jgi:tetratricopeptide (TPR) repeat protein
MSCWSCGFTAETTAETSAGIGLAELQMGHLEAARQMFTLELQFVTNDHARAQAHYMIGSAWLRETANGAADKEKLQAAEESFRKAVKLDPLYDLAYFNLAYALLGQDRQKESDAGFRDFINAAAENPESARDLPVTPKSHVPQFTVTDTGQAVSSDSLRGRFVLLDFWDLVPSLHSGSPRSAAALEVLSRRPVPAHQHQ